MGRFLRLVLAFVLVTLAVIGGHYAIVLGSRGTDDTAARLRTTCVMCHRG